MCTEAFDASIIRRDKFEVAFKNKKPTKEKRKQ